MSALGVSAANATSAPTLHGFCSTTNPCTDNGANTPTSVEPPVFGFATSGAAASGVVTIDILVPDNLSIPTPYTISGPLLGLSTYVASLVSATPWTSGQLDTYLGISGSPTNAIGAFLPATQAYQSSATGFYIFSANIGARTLPGNSATSDSALMTLNKNLPTGGYIVAFLGQEGSDTFGATSNSGAIFEKAKVGAVPEAGTWALMLIGFGGLGALLRRRRHSEMLAAAQGLS